MAKKVEDQITIIDFTDGYSVMLSNDIVTFVGNDLEVV